jgi:hypothetical protein
MIWLNWIVSPIGRWVSGVGGAIALLFAAYWKARSDGKEALRREQEAEQHRRLRNAIEADSRARERIARGELLKDDGHRRE